MSAQIFEKPQAVCSLEKKQTKKYSPFIDGQAYAHETAVIAIGAVVIGTVVGTVVGQIVRTAWPY